MIIVSNAGPLIALAKIEQFELLRELFGKLYISDLRPLLDELRARGFRLGDKVYAEILKR